MFGEQLRALRRRYRLSQQDIANLVGVSAVAVGKWERGLTTPDLPKLIILADYFRVSLDRLCGRVGWELRPAQGSGSVPFDADYANEMEPTVHPAVPMQTESFYESPYDVFHDGMREMSRPMVYEDQRPVAQDWQRSARSGQGAGHGDALELIGRARSAEPAVKRQPMELRESAGVEDYAAIRAAYASPGRAPAYAKVDPAAPVRRFRQGPEYAVAARAEGPVEREALEDLIERADGLFPKK